MMNTSHLLSDVWCSVGKYGIKDLMEFAVINILTSSDTL